MTNELIQRNNVPVNTESEYFLLLEMERISPQLGLSKRFRNRKEKAFRNWLDGQSERVRIEAR